MESLRALVDAAQEESAPSIAQKRPFHKAKNRSIIFKATGLVISREMPFLVIPAKAGIQCFQIVTNSLDPGFHRGDGFLCEPQRGFF
jgi:hypothetical protein